MKGDEGEGKAASDDGAPPSTCEPAGTNARAEAGGTKKEKKKRKKAMEREREMAKVILNPKT